MLNQERTVKKNCLLAGSNRACQYREGRCPGRCPQPLFFFATHLRKMTGPTFSNLRRVRANRSSANADELIRDVGDNVPPGIGCWRPTFFLRDALTKNDRADLFHLAPRPRQPFGRNSAELIRDVGDNVPPDIGCWRFAKRPRVFLSLAPRLR